MRFKVTPITATGKKLSSGILKTIDHEVHEVGEKLLVIQVKEPIKPMEYEQMVHVLKELDIQDKYFLIVQKGCEMVNIEKIGEEVT